MQEKNVSGAARDGGRPSDDAQQRLQERETVAIPPYVPPSDIEVAVREVLRFLRSCCADAGSAAQAVGAVFVNIDLWTYGIMPVMGLLNIRNLIWLWHNPWGLCPLIWIWSLHPFRP